MIRIVERKFGADINHIVLPFKPPLSGEKKKKTLTQKSKYISNQAIEDSSDTCQTLKKIPGIKIETRRQPY